MVNIFKTVTKNLVFSPTNQAGGFGLFSYHLMAFVFLTGFMNGVNYYAQGNSISKINEYCNFYVCLSFHPTLCLVSVLKN